ncbi:MAG: extracellular solute-binding protein [Chloroflexi bacterium]|nr:extracellular solute-binding protein [Chloroflexota bacterium]
MNLAVIVIISLLSVTVLACAEVAVTQQQATQPAKPGAAAPAKPGWEQDWERTLAEAKKEGSVAVYLSESDWRQQMAEVLSKKFGITLDMFTGNTGLVMERVMSEQRQGIYNADVIFMGTSQFKGSLEPAGVLTPLEKELLLPEVKDPKAWWRGELNWLDPDTRTFLNFREYPNPGMLINTDLVKREELKSWSNLLDPKWKGKIVLDDPVQGGGGGQRLMTVLAYGVMDWEYISRLVKQEPILVRNSRLMVEWVARGRNPILVGGRTDVGTEFIKSGSPAAFYTPAEGTYLGTGTGFAGRLRTSSHPNAARVFLNFFLSREGQTLYSRLSGYQSSRSDVPTDHLLSIREPGMKYFSVLEEGYMKKEMELRERVVEIFRPLSK